MTRHQIRGSWIIALCLAALGVCVAGAGLASGADSKEGVGVQPVERLMIRYNEGSFEIVERIPLEKILPPSVELPDSVGRLAGYWFEVQNTEGKTVYRRRMTAPDIIYTESPTEDEPNTLRRADIVVPDKLFSVLVPRKSEARALVFFGQQAGPEKRMRPAAELGRVVLR
jgi:hypothetical protein